MWEKAIIFDDKCIMAKKTLTPNMDFNPVIYKKILIYILSYQADSKTLFLHLFLSSFDKYIIDT